MKGLENVTIQKPRPLPVIILADTSGSMHENGEIESLNMALKEMILSFGQQGNLGAEINVGIITFGGEAEHHTMPKPAYQFEPEEMDTLTAEGGTPFGKAILLAKEMLEDKDIIPSRSYRPVIVALSDGHPTDRWEPALEQFFNSERASKTTRIAMAIGPDADTDVLSEFVKDENIPIVKAADARDIVKFFKCVTMSVQQSSIQASSLQSSNLKQLFEDEDLEF